MSGLVKNKSYLTLMMAQAISGIGDWLTVVAIITLVGLKWDASPIEVSLIILCLAVPMALLGPVAGTVADRFSRKALMITSDLVRAGLILVLTVADTVWVVYICLFTIGVFSAVFIPAKNGKLKELVAHNDMKSAMSITSMIDSSTKVMGPLLSGVLVTAFGTNPVFYIDSVTFFISALLILFLPGAVQSFEEDNRNEDRIDTSFKKEFLVGVTFIKSNTYILAGMFFLGFSLLILQLSDSQIIVLIRELTSASPDLFGYIVTSSGIGMFLSGLLLAKKTNYNAFALLLIGVCGMGLSFGIMAVLTHFDLRFSIIWGPLLGVFAGFSASLVFIPFQASVQIETPVHMTGRVFGVINSVTTTATIIGPLLGGWLSTILGVVPTFMITASLLVLVSLIGFFSKSKIERSKKNVSESQQGTSKATTS
jgi:MFS family permease